MISGINAMKLSCFLTILLCCLGSPAWVQAGEAAEILPLR